MYLPATLTPFDRRNSNRNGASQIIYGRENQDGLEKWSPLDSSAGNRTEIDPAMRLQAGSNPHWFAFEQEQRSYF
jgi:hypothetical protein